MIVFACSHCGLKITVKPEFAGRSSRCPTCKHPLVVPQPAAPQAIPAGEIDGTSSSLHQAGVESNVNLERENAAAAVAQQPVAELLARRTAKGERYIIDQEFARGGMGAILRAVDCDLRREVAIKYLLDQTDNRKKLRFIEEAQITGQLEHPNIVPIHELGIDARKRLFISMKLVGGQSLAQAVDQLRKNPQAAEKEYPLARLLRAFVAVCNAMAYAHARGVIHRDLKPANVMLGDFGAVYVMDWGLARVRPGITNPTQTPVAASVTTSRSSKVDTKQPAEADLTQDGTVLGTPVYMPPEQAAGHVEAVDRRSDIYSLGAILYEILTLQPPVQKDGGYMEVMVRVMRGDIIPPDQRDPARTRAGKVPRELAAIALKALAKHPEDRYPSAEALRRDIERFQEGRSVSAKHDSVRELVWKLLKRNSAVSLVSGVALVLLAIVWARSSWISYQEQKLRREQSVPAFIEAAHYAVDRKKFDSALLQVSTAVDYDPGRADALLLKGQLLIVKGNFPGARQELERYLRFKPQDADAAELLELCRKGNPQDATKAAAFAGVLRRQNALTLAAAMIQSREELLAFYRKQLDTAWPGVGAGLSMDKDGNCTLAVPATERDKVRELTPLQGIPLTALSLAGCLRVADLGPLQGSPLTSLDLGACAEVSDLTPLQGTKLTYLNLSGCRKVNDLAPLHNLPLTTLVLTDCVRVKDLSSLEGLKLTSLTLWSCTQIRDLTPLKGMPLRYLHLGGCNAIQDLKILRTFPLTSLDLSSCPQLRDLTILQNLKLTSLNLSYNVAIKDLSPLRGMSLTSLKLANFPQLQDLTPLQGMPLTALDISYCPKLTDLSPLKGMKLVTLDLRGTPARDLTLLQGMSLQELDLTPRLITSGMEAVRLMKSLRLIVTGHLLADRYSPEQFWKKFDAGEFR